MIFRLALFHSASVYFRLERLIVKRDRMLNDREIVQAAADSLPAILALRCRLLRTGKSTLSKLPGEVVLDVTSFVDLDACVALCSFLLKLVD